MWVKQDMRGREDVGAFFKHKVRGFATMRIASFLRRKEARSRGSMRNADRLSWACAQCTLRCSRYTHSALELMTHRLATRARSTSETKSLGDGQWYPTSIYLDTCTHFKYPPCPAKEVNSIPSYRIYEFYSLEHRSPTRPRLHNVE